MTEADAFLAAIIANPDDDLPRLVFADWLDEHDDSLRAEFIRGQCALAAGSTDIELAKRMVMIEAANRRNWSIPGVPGRQEFRRGFVEYLHTSASDFLTHAAQLERAAPIVDLRLIVANTLLREIVAVPWLSRLRGLDLKGNVGLGNFIEELVPDDRFRELRMLSLRNCQLWPDICGRFATLTARLPSLKRLDLSGNPISDEGIAHLANAPSLGGLTQLIVRCDEQQDEYAIHAEGALALANSQPLSGLTELNLAGHSIGNDGMMSLAQSSTLQNLETLDVSFNDIGNDDNDGWANAIASSETFHKLRRFSLAGNRILPSVAMVLRNWITSKESLKCIDLRRCEIDAESLAILEGDARVLLDPMSDEEL